MVRSIRVAVGLSLAVVLASCGDKSPAGAAGSLTPIVGQVLPVKGPTEGGTVAIIRGLNFRPGTTVSFGASPAPFVRVVDATTLTVVTPPGDAGKVNVVVASPEGQSTTFADGFTYYTKDSTTAPAPALSAMRPNTGPATGGTVALLTGSGFQDGALLFVGRVPGTDVHVVDASSLTGTTPANPVGPTDVEVTNLDGQTALLPAAFAYYDGEGVSPILNAITPEAGSTTGGTHAVIAGNNLKPGAMVFFGGRVATSVAASGATLSCDTPAAPPGVVDVAVTNADGRSAVMKNAYNFYVGGPLVAHISPAAGSPDGGTTVVIDGKNFQPNIITTIGGLPLEGARRVDERTITGITAAHAAGLADVRVENLDGQSDTLVGGFTYGLGGATDFALARVAPEVGPIIGGTRVTIIGSGFATGAAVTFAGQPATGVQVVGGATISCLTPPGSIGPAQVVVSQGGQTRSLPLGFWYFDPSKKGPTPSIAAITPALGPVTGGTTVLISGGGFVDGARVFFGTKEATGVTVASGLSLSAVTPAGDQNGPVDVRVMNPDGQVVVQNQGFVYVEPSALSTAPVITSVTPNSGGSADSASVTIAVQNVAQGALVFVGGLPATGVVITTGQVTATFPPHDPGTFEIVITNPDGQSGTLNSSFTYTQSPPTITSLTPNTVPLVGGLKVLLSGKGFVRGAQVLVDGAAVPSTYVDSTLIFFTAPAHTAGAVDVAVVNPDAQRFTLTAGLTFADITLGGAPTITSITPAKGPTTGGTYALVIGTNFTQGARVLFGANAGSTVTVMSDTRLTVVAPPGNVGTVDLSVINPDGQSAQLVQAFAYLDRSSLGAAPGLNSVTPASGVSTGGTQTVLTGSGFQQGLMVFFGGFTASAQAVQNAGIATATSPGGPKGVVDVAVTNPDGQSAVLTSGFSYTPTPKPSTIFPDHGPTGGGTSFTLAGANFSAGAKVFFDSIEATGVVVSSATVITGNTPPHAQGKVDVKVLNPDGQATTLTQGYTYNAPPTVTVARPGAGPIGGGSTIAITGTAFQAGATVTIGGVPATNVRFVSDTQLLAVVPAGSTGATDVVVKNPDAQAATLTDGFRYDVLDATAGRATTSPTIFVPTARDDAKYRTDFGVINLSGQAVTVTVAELDAAGVQVGSRDLAATVPAFGRAQVADILRFVEGVTTAVGRTASLVVSATGPVSAYATVTDLTSGDSSVLLGAPSDKAAGRVLVPYVSSVGAFSTWVMVRNVGSAATTIDLTARDPGGTQVGKLTAISVPAGGLYTTEDILGAMSVSSATATLEVSGASGAKLLVAARTYSNTRMGGLVWGRPYSEAAPTQVLSYVPDTSIETSSFYMVNTEGTASASVVADLRNSAGQSLGSRTFTVPASGFVQVADFARTVLAKTNATQTVSAVFLSSTKPLMAVTQVLSTSNSDLRMVNSRPGGGVRMIVPTVDQRTSLSVANVGIAVASVEITLKVDQGLARGVPLRVSIPPKGLFTTQLLTSSLGAGTASGYVELRSTNGIPFVAESKVGSDPNGNTGELFDLANVLTVPSLDAIRPNTGPATGGTMSLVSGQYFLPSPTFLFGSVPAPRAATAADDTAVVVSPAGKAGDVVDVTIVNFDGSSAALSQAFSYVDPSTLANPPTVSSVQPNQLSNLGGTAMQINGTNFNTQAKAFVGLTPVAGATQINPNRVDGASPAGPIGPTDVTVTNPDGQSATLTGAATYVVPPPTINTLTPNSGPGKGGTVVRIDGNGFQVGAGVSFGPNAAPVVTVLSPTQIDALTPQGVDGPVAVTLTNPDGQSRTANNAFTYVAAPTVTSVQPTSGSTAGGTTITITGTFLRSGATVKVGGSDCLSVNVSTGGTTITCTTPAGSQGPVAITVTNSDGQVGLLNNAFTYLAPIPPPTVTAASPSYGPITGNTQVTIQGTNFQAGASVKFGTLDAVAVTVISPTALLATTPGAAAIGPVEVRVTNPDTQFGKLPNGFTYYQPADLPGIGISTLTPNEGPSAGGTQTFISGQGFKAGVTVNFRTAPATNVTYLGPSALLVTSPPGALGMASVTATNPDGASFTITNGFNYSNGVVFKNPPMRLPPQAERGYYQVMMIDYDGDGDLDAYLGKGPVSCDSNGDDELWTNDGTGTFSLLSSFPGDARRQSNIAVQADFDANGTQDIVVLPTDTWYNSPSFYKNYPLGTFTRSDMPTLPGQTCCGTAIRDAAIGDLNGDGYPDIYVVVAGGNNWYSYYYLNNKNGTFTATRAGLPSAPTINPQDGHGVCIADFDRDGDDDVFVVNGSNQQANYFLQGPKQVFTSVPAGATLPVIGGNGVGCIAAELRPGSGIKDVVVVKDGQIYQYLKNDGAGNFTDEGIKFGIYRLPNSPASLNIGFPGPAGYVRGVQAIDIDSDGDLDLVMNHYNTNPRIQVYVNDGAGFFTLGTASRVPPTIDAVQSWDFADVNSDGRPDTIIPGYGQQHRLLLGQSGTPAGKLAYATMKTLPDTWLNSSDAVNADIDGDGDQDLVIMNAWRFDMYYSWNSYQEPASYRQNSVKIWLNDGAGGFTDDTVNRINFQLGATAVAAGDIDKDGDIDLVVGISGMDPASPGTRNQPSVRLLLNDGTGVFTDVTYPRMPAWVAAMTVIRLVDINNDGWLDVYGAYYIPTCAGGQVLGLNTGNGFFFDVSGQLAVKSWGCNSFIPYSATFGDFNKDGYQDYYLAGNGQSLYFLNQGVTKPGYYTDNTASKLPAVSLNSYGLVSGDFNGDTFPDIFVCNAGGNGDARGRDHVFLGGPTGTMSDITGTNWPSESQPYPYQSQCGGTISPVNSITCAGADVDQDGDIDFVVGGWPSSNFNMRTRLFLNNGNALFTDATTASIPMDSANTSKVLIFDANGDGKPDIFMGNNGQPYVYLQGP